jgi:hypothetical protein
MVKGDADETDPVVPDGGFVPTLLYAILMATSKLWTSIGGSF